MAPKIRAPQASIRENARREERRVDAYVNRDALQRWLSATPPTKPGRGPLRVVRGSSNFSDD